MKEHKAMNRLHIHVSVEDLPLSIRFYGALFGSKPTVLKPDYAKWMLDDPRVNFAISARGKGVGVEHLGIQVETPDELRKVYERLQQADQPVLEEGTTTCCYAKSEKSWISDPQGLLWETFLTNGENTVYGDDPNFEAIQDEACCTPATPQGVCCAPKPELSADATCCTPRSRANP
jgi:catechol 2,3-dioxygenase-like lactoylglutathione lyase family enzyme